MKNKKYTDDYNKCSYEVLAKMCGAMGDNTYAQIRLSKLFIVALFWLIIYRFKYPQVILCVSGRALRCNYCPYENCENRDIFKSE